MTFSTIAVHLEVDLPIAPRLAFAAAVADRFDADLIAFTAADEAVFIPGTVDVPVSTTPQRVESIDQRLSALKQEYLDLAEGNPRARRIEAIGEPTRMLSLVARGADLLIVGGPRPGWSTQRNKSVDAGR